MDTPNGYTTWDGEYRPWKYTDEERPNAVCYDCLRPYGTFEDLVIPNEAWAKINPTYHEGAGLLCPGCICDRLAWIKEFGVKAEIW